MSHNLFIHSKILKNFNNKRNKNYYKKWKDPYSCHTAIVGISLLGCDWLWRENEQREICERECEKRERCEK
jgi:hypothetical protein